MASAPCSILAAAGNIVQPKVALRLSFLPLALLAGKSSTIDIIPTGVARQAKKPAPKHFKLALASEGQHTGGGGESCPYREVCARLPRGLRFPKFRR